MRIFQTLKSSETQKKVDYNKQKFTKKKKQRNKIEETYVGEVKGKEGKAWLRTLRAILESFFGSNRRHCSRLFFGTTESEEQQQPPNRCTLSPTFSSSPLPMPEKNLRWRRSSPVAESSKLRQWSRRNETSSCRLWSLILKNGVVNPPAELAAINVEFTSLFDYLSRIADWNSIWIKERKTD